MSASASADLLRLLAAIAETPTPAHARYAQTLGLNAPAQMQDWQIAHAGAFIEQCPPYASVYVGEHGRIGGEAADRVAGFRSLLGADVDEHPDHLPALLRDYAELARRSATDARARHARAAMLWEHLLSWLMPYLHALQRCAPAPYDQWAAMVRDVFLLEAEAIAPPAQLPLHLRHAPARQGLAEADSADAAIRALLIPGATGVIYTRGDLTRAVQALEAGFVQNSRAFMLRILLDQDAPGALAWLAEEARIQARARADDQPALGAVGRFWVRRAEATTEALAAMAAQAGRGSTNSAMSRNQDTARSA